VARKRKIEDPDQVWVTWVTLGYGVTGFFAFTKEHFAPVASVYALVSGKNQDGKAYAEIIDSFVHPAFRRQGLRSRINRSLFENWEVDVICSHSSTKSGRAFMEATGYTKDDHGRWSLSKKTWQEMRQAASR
jgi:hypothetical protein